MKIISTTLLAIAILAITAINSSTTEAKKRHSVYRCTYDHTITNELSEQRVKTEISADVAIPALCPALPDDVYLSDVGEEEFKAHFNGLEPGEDEPGDVACTHSNPQSSVIFVGI